MPSGVKTGHPFLVFFGVVFECCRVLAAFGSWRGSKNASAFSGINDWKLITLRARIDPQHGLNRGKSAKPSQLAAVKHSKWAGCTAGKQRLTGYTLP